METRAVIVEQSGHVSVATGSFSGGVFNLDAELRKGGKVQRIIDLGDKKLLFLDVPGESGVLVRFFKRWLRPLFSVDRTAPVHREAECPAT